MGGTPPLLEPHQDRNFSTPLYPHPHRRRSVSLRHFPEGSLVEIQTDEEDFKGVYFSATVIPSPPTSKKACSKQVSKRIYVEYHDLLAREDGSERLKEYVDISFVRPAPPKEIASDLAPNDFVDAFYIDGWWTGVVTRVVEGDARFVVNFQNPPDELEFGLAELRVHWDWVGGSWVRPGKQAEANSTSELGQKVEVSRDKDKTHYSWFRATICKSLDDGALLVEFCTLKDNVGGPVRGEISPTDVRPCPPHLKDVKKFVVQEKVDAYFELGWWAGVITKVLEGGKYVVYFKKRKIDKEFHQSALRPHMEWKGGKWFTTSKFSKVTSESSSGNTIGGVSDNSSGKINTADGNTLRLRKEDRHENSRQNPSSKGTLPLSKKRRDLSDSRDTPSRTLKKHNTGNVIRASEQDKQHDSSITKMSLDSPSPVATLTAEGDQSSGILSHKKTIQRKKREVISTQNGDKVVSASSFTKNNTPISQGKELGTEVVEDVQSVHLKKLSVPVVIGLPCTVKGSSVSGSSSGAKGHRSNCKEKNLVSDQKQQPDNVAVQQLKDSTPSETKASGGKRKRGRPPKNVDIPLKASNNGDNVEKNAENGIVATADGLSTHESDQNRTADAEEGAEASLPNKENTLAADYQPPDPITKGSAVETTSAKSNQAEKLVKESIGLQPDRESKRGSQPVNGQTFESQVEDASGSKTIEVIVLDGDEDVMEEPPCNVVLGDEPLSNGIEGMQSPSTVNISRQSIDQQLETNAPVVKENDDEQQTKAGEKNSNSTEKISVGTPDEQPSLPFVKNTFLWKTIEAMEVFKQTPQKPHFQTLKQQKESLREGMAIGYMVNFSSVVEKVSKLQLGDPKSITDDILDTLAELETHGFDVGVVRDRVFGLMAVGDKQGKLVNEANELDAQISRRCHEKCKIEKEISEMSEELRRLREKLSLAQSALENENGEMSDLQAKLAETKQGIINVEREFQGIASSKF